MMFSIIHHTPIGWYQGTVHLCEQVIGRVNTLLEQHPREETTDGLFKVRSHHALFADWLGILRADGDLTGLRIMKAINIGIGIRSNPGWWQTSAGVLFPKSWVQLLASHQLAMGN